MNLLVTPNTDKKGIYESTTKLCKALHEHGAKIYMLNSDSELFKGCCDISGGNINELTRKSDAVIALGGDGTILRSATIAAVYDKPILGLNQGRLGFPPKLEREGAGKEEGGLNVHLPSIGVTERPSIIC